VAIEVAGTHSPLSRRIATPLTVALHSIHLLPLYGRLKD
jgi:hypothetical protein